MRNEKKIAPSCIKQKKEVKLLVAVTSIACLLLFMGLRFNERNRRIELEIQRTKENQLRDAQNRADLFAAGRRWADSSTLYLTPPNSKTSDCHSLAFSADGNLLASGNGSDDWNFRGNHKVHLWNARTGALQRILPRFRNRLSYVCFSTDGKTLCGDSVYEGWKTLSLWAIKTGKMKQVLHLPNKIPDRYFLTHETVDLMNRTGAVHFLDAGKAGATIRKRQAWIRKVLQFERDRNRRVLAISADSKSVACRITENHQISVGVSDVYFRLRLLDAHTGKLLRTFTNTICKDERYISIAAFSPDGTMLASVHVPTGGNTASLANMWEESTVNIWDVSTGELLHSVPTSTVNAMAFSPNSKRLAIGGRKEKQNHTIEIWQVK